MTNRLPWKITMLLIGKPSIDGAFSMAMLNNQMVKRLALPLFRGTCPCPAFPRLRNWWSVGQLVPGMDPCQNIKSDWVSRFIWYVYIYISLIIYIYHIYIYTYNSSLFHKDLDVFFSKLWIQLASYNCWVAFVSESTKLCGLSHSIGVVDSESLPCSHWRLQTSIYSFTPKVVLKWHLCLNHKNVILEVKTESQKLNTRLTYHSPIRNVGWVS